MWVKNLEKDRTITAGFLPMNFTGDHPRRTRILKLHRDRKNENFRPNRRTKSRSDSGVPMGIPEPGGPDCLERNGSRSRTDERNTGCRTSSAESLLIYA